MPVGGLPNIGGSCFMNSCLQIVSHVKHVGSVLRDPTCSTFVVNMLRRVSKGARVSASSLRTFVHQCNKDFGMQRRDGEHYDAKECFDFVFSNDFCPALREVFQCVTLPGATCPACKEVFHYELAPNSGIQLPLHAGQNVQQLVDSALATSSASRRCECGYSGPTPQHDTIVKYPKVMVLQLLRFNRLRKICSRNDHRLVMQLHVSGGEGCDFSLRGVVEHVGNDRHSGHYISYVLDDDVWYKISDASVSIITEAELLGVEAYLCFYEADNVLPDNEFVGVSQPASSTVELGNVDVNMHNTTSHLTCDIETSEMWTVPHKRVRITVLKASAMTETQTSRFGVLRPADDEVPSTETGMMMNTALRGSEPRTQKRKARNSRTSTQSPPWIPDWGRIATRRIVEKGWQCEHTVAQITKRVMQELSFNENTRTNVQKYVTNMVIELNKEHNSVKPSVETEGMQCTHTCQSSGTKNRETARMNKNLRFRIINILKSIQAQEPRGEQRLTAAEYTDKVYEQLDGNVNATFTQVNTVIIRHMSNEHPKIRRADSMAEGVEVMVDGDQRVDMDAGPCKRPAPINGQSSDKKNSDTARMTKNLRYRIINILQNIQAQEPRGEQQLKAAEYTAKVYEQLDGNVTATFTQVNTVIIRHMSNEHPKIRRAESMAEGVAKYQQLIQQVPNVECSCCNQAWFPASISSATDKILSKIPERLKGVLKRDELGTIMNIFCCTCLSNMREGKVPAQSALTGVRFPDIPACLMGLNELEQRLVAVRQYFGQIIGLRSGGQRCLKGSVINVPAKLHQVQKHLPRYYKESDTVACQLVRRLAFNSYYLQNNIRPARVMDAIAYLVTTPLYVQENVIVRKDWKYICEDDRLALENEERAVTDAIAHGTSETNDHGALESFNEEAACDLAVGDDSEQEVNAFTGDAVTFLDDGATAELTRDLVLRFAPSENEVPKSLVLDEFAEDLAYPCVFGGYPRTKSSLTYTKINAWELRSIDPRVARNSDILFVKLKKSEAMKIMTCANVRMRKGSAGGRTYTAKDVHSQEKRACLIEQDLGYRDLTGIKSSDDHLEKSRKDILAMMRQLGVPSLFVTFTAADTHWVEVLKMLSKTVHNKDLSDEELQALTWEQRAELIRKDPVTTARYYKHRMDALFNFMIKHGPNLFGGELVDHCFVEEFQKRGTPHRHALFWIKGAPIYKDDNDAEFVAYYSPMMSTASQGLAQHLCVAQRHRCSSAYCMSKHKVCRFGAPWCPVPATCLLKPFGENEDPPDSMSIADLKKVYGCIRAKITELDTLLKKHRDCNEPEHITISNMTFQDFLALCGVQMDVYMHALRTTLKREVLLCKREVRDMRMNAYHPVLLPLTRANMDIQPVINAYAAVLYVTSYLVKGDWNLSRLLRETKTACNAGGVSVGERVRKIGNILMNSTEISAQQAVFMLLSMPLKHQSSATVWVPTAPCGESFAFSTGKKEF